MKYATNSLIWLAERQSVHRRTDWRIDRTTHQHSKQRSNSAKFCLILFYLGMYTIKLLLTEISVHTGNICSDIQGAWTSLCSVHTPWMLEQNFLVSTSSSVNKRIWTNKFLETSGIKLRFVLLQTTKTVVSSLYCGKMSASQMRLNMSNNNNSQGITVPTMKEQRVASQPWWHLLQRFGRIFHSKIT